MQGGVTAHLLLQQLILYIHLSHLIKIKLSCKLLCVKAALENTGLQNQGTLEFDSNNQSVLI